MHIYGIQKDDTDELSCRAAMGARQRTDLGTQWGKERVGRTDRSMETCTLPYTKQVPRGNLTNDSGSSNQ